MKLILVSLLCGPFDGLQIHGPDCEAIRFRGRLLLRTGDLTGDGLPIYFDCGRHFESLMDGIEDVEPGKL